MNTELNNKLAQLILRIARSVFSYTVNYDKVTKLQDILEDVVIIISKIAESKSVEVAKKVQEATKAGFEAFAADMDQLKAKVKALETRKIFEEFDTKELPKAVYTVGSGLSPEEIARDFPLGFYGNDQD